MNNMNEKKIQDMTDEEVLNHVARAIHDYCSGIAGDLEGVII